MKNKQIIFALLLILISWNGFSQITEIGLASFYADKFDGRITASGDIFNQKKMTAAHRTLPFGTLVKVTNLENNKTIEVVINDRGPFINDRVIDLSKAGAIKLDFVKKGVTKVKVEVKGLAKNKKKTEPVVVATATSKPKKEPKKSAPVPAPTKASNSVNSEGLSYYKVDADLITPQGYGIQIASYQEAANLMQRCNEVKQDENQDIIIQVAETKGKKVYRIIIGAFSTKEAAEKYKKRMNQKYSGSFIIKL